MNGFLSWGRGEGIKVKSGLRRDFVGCLLLMPCQYLPIYVLFARRFHEYTQPGLRREQNR